MHHTMEHWKINWIFKYLNNIFTPKSLLPTLAFEFWNSFCVEKPLSTQKNKHVFESFWKKWKSTYYIDLLSTMKRKKENWENLEEVIMLNCWCDTGLIVISNSVFINSESEASSESVKLRIIYSTHCLFNFLKLVMNCWFQMCRISTPIS